MRDVGQIGFMESVGMVMGNEVLCNALTCNLFPSVPGCDDFHICFIRAQKMQDGCMNGARTIEGHESGLNPL